MRFHDLLKIIDHKGIRAAFKRCDQYGIRTVGLCDDLCSLQYFSGIVPVQFGEQGPNRRHVRPAVREHILIKRLDAQRRKNIRDTLVHVWAQHGIGPAQQNHVDIFACFGQVSFV